MKSYKMHKYSIILYITNMNCVKFIHLKLSLS